MSNLRLEPTKDHTSIVMDGRVDIRDAAEFQKLLCDAVSGSLPVVIDCASAEWLDTSCLQLMLAAHRSAPGRVSIKAGSEGVVRQWLDQSGFAAELSLA